MVAPILNIHRVLHCTVLEDEIPEPHGHSWCGSVAFGWLVIVPWLSWLARPWVLKCGTKETISWQIMTNQGWWQMRMTLLFRIPLTWRSRVITVPANEGKIGELPRSLSWLGRWIKPSCGCRCCFVFVANGYLFNPIYIPQSWPLGSAHGRWVEIMCHKDQCSRLKSQGTASRLWRMRNN